MLQLFIQSGWLSVSGDSRALQVTPTGVRELDLFGKAPELEMAL